MLIINGKGAPLYTKHLSHSVYPLCLSYIPSDMHVGPGYRENPADLQGTLKLHLSIITKYQDPAMKIGMYIFSACTQDGYKRIHV